MSAIFAHASPLLLLAGAIPLVYIAGVTIGRWLKRRQKVHLGFGYQLLCIVVAFWLPLQVYARKVPGGDALLGDLLRGLDAVAAVLGMFFFIALIRRYFWQLWFERRFRERAPKFLSDLGALLLFAAAVVFAISRLRGQPITGIAVGSTLLAAIIGLALQDLLGNLIAGISLEIGRPFRAGDWLLLNDRSMEVIELNWRSTRLRTNDDVYLDVPNKNIAGSIITNLTLHTRQHALRIHVGFDACVPPNLVKTRIGQAVAQARGVLANPPPKVFLHQFADSAITYEIKFWIEDEAQRNDILDAVHTNVWYEAQRSQIRIPYPVRTVHLERANSRPDDCLEAARACLRRQPFLQTLSEEQGNRLLRGARRLRFGNGERVIEQGAEGQSMFMMLAGVADVFVRSHGHETQVGTIVAGEYCGEMSLLTGEPRSATVIARGDCEMWEIEKFALAGIFQENRELVKKLGHLLAQRRLENEGILAHTESARETQQKEEEYTAGFLARLSSFFEL